MTEGSTSVLEHFYIFQEDENETFHYLCQVIVCRYGRTFSFNISGLFPENELWVPVN